MAGRPITKAANAALDKIGIETILNKIAEGMITKDIAAAAGVSRPILSAYLNRNEHADAYRRARETRAANHAEKIEELAGMVEAGTIETNAARVSIDARKWIAARMDPARWAENKGVAVNISITDLHLGSLRKAPIVIDQDQ
jgi:hypothetical protein